MTDRPGLSRRERQIMDILFAQEGATVAEVCAALPDPPTDKAIRRLMHILEEKGHVRRRQRGREFVYIPKQSRKSAGSRAFQHVLDTFYGGALDAALAAHLTKRQTEMDPAELARLEQLIEDARKQGR